MAESTPLLVESTEDEEYDCRVSDSKANKSKKEIKCYPQNRNMKYIAIMLALALFTVYYLDIGDWSDSDLLSVIHKSYFPGSSEIQDLYVPAYVKRYYNILANQEDMTAADRSTLSSTEVNYVSPITISRIQTNSTCSAFKIQDYLLPTPPSPPRGYLVWSNSCHIEEPDIYHPSTMKYFKMQKYKDCVDTRPLTNISFDPETLRYVISIDEEVTKLDSKSEVQLDCCYNKIERNSTGKSPDNNVSLGPCLKFNNLVQLPNTTDNVIVKCHRDKKQVYINGYATMAERSDIRKRLRDWKERNPLGKPFSVLMLGIDSVSRLNFLRAMPNTAKFVNDNGWFEMSGYNKIGDNTFPNLMAVLTGYNNSRAFSECNPKVRGKLDNCPFIWKKFKEQGYVTAYAEDETQISTFNYLKDGFMKSPVDYYLRPFLIQAEKSLPGETKSGLTFCLGYKHASDYVYDYAVELTNRYKGFPFFGFFWANTFSHQAISDPSSMDTKITEYLQNFSKDGVLNETIVFFFSDHGIRFGPTRASSLGYYEERLPFMYIWLPKWIKESYPEFATALRANKNQLTNPYDIQMTLQHIVELAKGGSHSMEKTTQSDGCPKCQSLLKYVPSNRSCEDVSIEDHWCTCLSYDKMKVTDKIGKEIGEAVIDYINDYVAKLSLDSYCRKLSLGTIKYLTKVRKTVSSGHKDTPNTYRITFSTLPNEGIFEATVRHTPKEKKKITIAGEISRLNSYEWDARCVQGSEAKKFCSCKT